MVARSSRLVLRPGWEDRTPFLFRGLLDHSDHGVCLTGLDRRLLACNARFGEIFGLDPDPLVASDDPEALRVSYLHRLGDPATWLREQDRIYGDPHLSHQDEIELVGPAKWVRRFAGPVYGDEVHPVPRTPVARVWTFRDVTAERREAVLRERLYTISIFNDPSPAAVLAYVAETVGRHYGATCVLSVLRDGLLDHRALGGPPTPLAAMLGTTNEASYGHLPIEAGGPVIVPDTRLDPRTARLLPTRLGYVAYAGVPILGSGGREGDIVGALCLMMEDADPGTGTGTPRLEDADLRFLAHAAARVTTELERERYIERTIASRQSVVETQAADLASTREVLDAMVHALRLVSFDEPIESVLVAQAALLENLLGFGTAAIVATVHPNAAANPDHALLATPYEHRRVDRLDGLMSLQEPTWLRRDVIKGLGLEDFPEALAVPLAGQRADYGVLLFSADRRLDLDDHRRTHLDALAEQISLTMEAYALRADLVEMKNDLEESQARTVESEKLASVGVLSAVVAHDIKNIVAAISIEIATTTEPVRTLAAVRRHLDRFAVLSHRLLSYAKPRMVVKKRLDVDEVIGRVTNLMAETMRISDIQLVTTPPKAPNIVLGDPNQLEHLFTNILVNSVQAMSAGRGGLLEIRTKRVGRRIIVEVRDTGPGMKEEILDRAFDPFYSVRHEGFGLGLYAARRIALEHGGDVKASSTPGVGTVLTVTLQAAPNDL